MATDATNTPSTNFSIPKYLTSADAPSGKGFNAAIDFIDTLLKKGFTILTTTGDMPYASAANVTSRLPIGSTGNILTVAGGIPSWAAPAVTAGAATVATTVAGLGTASDGKLGRIRGGSSPYDFVNLVYDATYAKWVGEEFDVGIVADASTAGDNTAGAWKVITAGAGNTYIGSAFLPLKPLTDAGLSLQLRVAGDMKRTNTSSHKLGTLVQTIDPGGAAISIGNTIVTATINSTSYLGVDSGWQVAVAANDATAKSIGIVFFFTNSDGADTFFGRAGVMARWVG